MKPVGHWNKDFEDKRYQYNLNKDSIVLDFGGYTGMWARDLAIKFDCIIYWIGVSICLVIMNIEI
jgi:hypothetical protein